MKNYDDLTNRLLERRDRYAVEQKKRKQRILRVSASVGCAALVSLAGFALYKNGGFREKLPVTDGTPTTTTTATPAQTEDTTTAITTATTTDGGVVAPTTTATTTATGESTTPSKTETTANKTPSKSTTTPSRTESTTTITTATTTAPKKSVITGDAPDTNCVDVSEAEYYAHGYISPLLQETMERYKGEDVLYAVIVAVKYKKADNYDDLYNAFLESDEMVDLAERRDLAYEEWKAADAENYYKKREAYLTLAREYGRKQKDFWDTHRSAGLQESLALLSEFSDIELIPLTDRLKPDMDWSEEYPIRCALKMAEYGEHAYVAVLSADEISELSERIGCMYWLDSYDEDYLTPWTINE